MRLPSACASSTAITCSIHSWSRASFHQDMREQKGVTLLAPVLGDPRQSFRSRRNTDFPSPWWRR